MYSPGGTHISQPPRRGINLPHFLVNTPSRPSYQSQMSRHWISPRAQRQRRSASPRKTPPDSRFGSPRAQSDTIAAKRIKIEGYNDSPSPSSDNGGVPIPAPPLNVTNNGLDGTFDLMVRGSEKDQASSKHGALHSADDFAPLHDLEAAVAQCFDTPTPTREERRKTLHITPPEPLPHAHTHPAKKADSPSSSEEWTGDDIFLPKVLPKKRVYRVNQMRGPPQQIQAVSCPAGTTCSRSPLRQRQDSCVRTTPKKSRFRVVAPEMPCGM